MGHWTLRNYFFDLQSNGVGFERPDPDRQYGLRLDPFQDHDGRVRVWIHDQRPDLYFYQVIFAIDHANYTPSPYREFDFTSVILTSTTFPRNLWSAAKFTTR